jgi:hypothetical protein
VGVGCTQVEASQRFNYAASTLLPLQLFGKQFSHFDTGFSSFFSTRQEE